MYTDNVLDAIERVEDAAVVENNEHSVISDIYNAASVALGIILNDDVDITKKDSMDQGWLFSCEDGFLTVNSLAVNFAEERLDMPISEDMPILKSCTNYVEGLYNYVAPLNKGVFINNDDVDKIINTLIYGIKNKLGDYEHLTIWKALLAYFIPDSSNDEPTCDAPVSEDDTANNINDIEEASINNNSVYFNSNDWELSAPKTYSYKGSNSLYPNIITADDFNLNSLLDMCMSSDFTSDNKAFYIKSEPTSDRKNGASKSFMFLKDGSAVYCVDSVTHKMRELSMSAAGGKDGIVSRPYYYISFPLAGKSRQLPLHKILAVFAHAEELIAVRNKIGVPLCGLVPNHKNNNGIDNDITNLEWVSPDENKLHSSAVELLAMADGGSFKYLVDKEHNTDVWVSAKDQWVIPNRNILNFQLSIKDIYKYLETHHITIAGHSIRAIVNIHDFIKFLKSEGVIKEA